MKDIIRRHLQRCRPVLRQLQVASLPCPEISLCPLQNLASYLHPSQPPSPPPLLSVTAPPLQIDVPMYLPNPSLYPLQASAVAKQVKIDAMDVSGEVDGSTSTSGSSSSSSGGAGSSSSSHVSSASAVLRLFGVLEGGGSVGFLMSRQSLLERGLVALDATPAE